MSKQQLNVAWHQVEHTDVMDSNQAEVILGDQSRGAPLHGKIILPWRTGSVPMTAGHAATRRCRYITHQRYLVVGLLCTPHSCSFVSSHELRRSVVSNEVRRAPLARVCVAGQEMRSLLLSSSPRLSTRLVSKKQRMSQTTASDSPLRTCTGGVRHTPVEYTE